MGALALGRFVFLPFHRASLAKAGMPKQNGMTHLQVCMGTAAQCGSLAGGCSSAVCHAP